MKKIKVLLAICILILITGCSKKENKELEQYKKEAYDKLISKYETHCNDSGYVEENEDKIVYYFFSTTVYYDDLDSKEWGISFYNSYDFDNYDDALAYKNKIEKEETTWEEVEIEENIDTQKTSVIATTYKLSERYEHDESARDYIHSLQKDDYECKTTEIDK